MIANVPVVLPGHRIANRLSMPLVHAVTALLFFVPGVLVLLVGADRMIGA